MLSLESVIFGMERVCFLGHVISKKGVSVDPTKVEAIVNWPRPTNITKVQSFLGIASYYRRFVEGFSKIGLPLTKLLCKDNKFAWTEESETSFKNLSNA